MTAVSVVIAICTYRRPQQLTSLLQSLNALCFKKCTAPAITIVVVDNDSDESAHPVVESVRGVLATPIRYVVESSRGLASVRNAALVAGESFDYLAFVDDDERVTPTWLDELLWIATGKSADFVIGPVRPVFPVRCPDYFKASGLYARHELPDGSPIATGNTGNALLDMFSLRNKGIKFRDDFDHSGGEDACFFSELCASGGRGAYAANAIAYEPVASDRLTIKWLMKRRFRFGTTEVRQKQITAKYSALESIEFLIRGSLRLGVSLVLVLVTLPISRGKALRYACAGARGAGYIAGVIGFNAREY